MQGDELATTNGHAGKLATMPGEPTIGTILQTAVAGNMDIERLGKVFELYEREMNRKAAQAFSAAMAEFKAKCPPIERRTENAQFSVTRGGQKVNRKYAALEDIERTIRKPLGECGLSYRWTGTKVEGGLLSMSCVVRHIDGHTEESSVSLPVASNAGCSEAQKFGSAMTYAQRFSLIQALGLTTCNEDDDANEEPGAASTIDDKQALRIEGMLSDTNSKVEAFTKHFGIERISDLPAHRFVEAINAINERAKKAAAKVKP